MKPAPLPLNEEERLKELYEYQILDTPEEKIFNTIVSLAASICDVPISLVTLVDRDRQWYKAQVGMELGKIQTDRKTAFCAYTILSSHIFEVVDATKDERFYDNPNVTGDPHIRFYGGFPLINSNGYKLGSLCVIDRKPKQLSEKQKRQLQELSEIAMTLMTAKKNMIFELKRRQKIASKLENVNNELGSKLKEQERNFSNLSLLSQMNGMLESCLSDEEAFKVIKQFCLNLFSTATGMIYLMEEHHEYIELKATWGQEFNSEAVLSADDCWGLRRGQYYLSQDNHDLKCNHLTNVAFKRSMCIPLVAQGETLGLLSLIFNDTLTEKDLNIQKSTEHLLAMAMGEQISIALANIKLRQTLREQSIYDVLTGLVNRRYLFEVYRREISKTLRLNSKLILDMIDIDYFKKFNDQFGHGAGDVVLQAVAEQLKLHLDSDDMACRLGGEEFVIIFQNTCLEDAIKTAESLRQSIEKIELHYQGKNLGHITISQGLALFPDDAKSLEELLKKADDALYQAKDTGRNRIVVAKDVKPRKS